LGSGSHVQFAIQKNEVTIENLTLNQFNKFIEKKFLTIDNRIVYITPFKGEVAYWTGILDISPLDRKLGVNEIKIQLLSILRKNSIYSYQIVYNNSRLYVPFSSEFTLLQFIKLELFIFNTKLQIFNDM
jgi:hypothetical protein